MSYPRTANHLIPLELGGSNDIKNLWPQPDMPKPGAGRRISLRTHALYELGCTQGASGRQHLCRLILRRDRLLRSSSKLESLLELASD